MLKSGGKLVNLPDKFPNPRAPNKRPIIITEVEIELAGIIEVSQTQSNCVTTVEVNVLEGEYL